MTLLTRRIALLSTILAALVVASLACGGSEPEFDPADFDPLTTVPAELDVNSPDIQAGGEIPARFTCDGEDLPPVFSWERPPDGTQSVAVIVDDPDAPGGTFFHWTVFNIDPDDNSVRGVIENGAPTGDGPVQGVNDFGETGYGGPCPPRGETHEYRFNVYALIAPLELSEDATAEDVLTAMRGSVIGHGKMSATYTRQ